MSPRPGGRSGGRRPRVTLETQAPLVQRASQQTKRARGRSPRLEAAPPTRVGSDGPTGRLIEPLSLGTWGTAGLLWSRPWGWHIIQCVPTGSCPSGLSTRPPGRSPGSGRAAPRSARAQAKKAGQCHCSPSESAGQWRPPLNRLLIYMTPMKTLRQGKEGERIEESLQSIKVSEHISARSGMKGHVWAQCGGTV